MLSGRGRVEWRHVSAVLLGLLVLGVPLYVLRFDPDSALHRIQSPLCRGGLTVEMTNQNGGAFLNRPDTGLKVRAFVDGDAIPVRFTFYERVAGGDWRYRWSLDAPEGREIYYLPGVQDGMEVYARASDPTGALCSADSPVLGTVAP